MATARVPDRVPAIASNSGEYRFGLDFSANAAVTIPGVWWYWVAGGPPSVDARLYSGSTLVASGTAVPSGPDGWVLIPFTTPYSLAASVTLSAVAHIPSGNYKYDNSPYLPKNDAVVTVPQGRFQSAEGGLPTSTWTGAHGVAVAYSLAGTSTGGFMAFF